VQLTPHPYTQQEEDKTIEIVKEKERQYRKKERGQRSRPGGKKRPNR